MRSCKKERESSDAFEFESVKVDVSINSSAETLKVLSDKKINKKTLKMQSRLFIVNGKVLKFNLA
tara:strand:+ start:34 stop:228 length:195 start_codon:yes stop_codon:yes gene_type:complete